MDPKRTPLAPNIMMFIRMVLVLVCIAPLISQAEEVPGFVTQDADVKLRTGYGKRVHVVKPLDPGTPLTVIGVNTKNGISEVRLGSGEEGWVASRFISTEGAPVNAIPPVVTESLTEDLAAKSTQELILEVNRLRTEMIAVRQAANDSLKIQTERDQLQQTVIGLKQELESANREKNMMNDDQKQAWFLIGGAVLFLGIILGVLLPRLSVRRKTDWGTF